MKVKITEEKLYPVFKKFMEIYFKKYEWRKDIFGIIWFMDPEGDGHLGLKNKDLFIYRGISENILRFLPMEESMLDSLISRWVGDTFQIEGINTIQTIPVPNQFVGETFPL
jgi:hypothetical protein